MKSKPQYMEIVTGMRFSTKYDDGTKVISQYVSFIPDETIKCNPPFIKGKMDGVWIKYNPKISKPNCFDKSDCEKRIGIKLQEFPNQSKEQT